jgi:hypothetical protein
MPDRKPKPDRPTPRKEKLCKTCKRPFHWTEQNSRDWDILKYCSEACSGHRAGEKDAALEAAILQLLAERETDGDRSKTICPSEAARLVAGDPRNKSHAARRDWEALMEPARSAARRLVAQGRIVITQHNPPGRSLHCKRIHPFTTPLKTVQRCTIKMPRTLHENAAICL